MQIFRETQFFDRTHEIFNKDTYCSVFRTHTKFPGKRCFQNHGILTTGPSVDIALWFYMSMERCCQAQLMAEAAGKPISVSHETAIKTREFIANDIAAWASYQPAFDKIVKMQSDLLD